jgi:hypothetical protein
MPASRRLGAANPSLAPNIVITVALMGKFTTRRHRGDKELQEQVLAESRLLYQNETPLSTAIDRLLELAGGNRNAFGLGGSKYHEFIQSPEGKAITRLMLGAEMKRTSGFTVPADDWWPGGN